jgi:hypothetical protein
MRKRTAEKVIARSILALAPYRKSTINKALRRRPRFWTVHKPLPGDPSDSPRKRLRLEFGEEGTGSQLLFDEGVDTGTGAADRFDDRDPDARSGIEAGFGDRRADPLDDDAPPRGNA